MDGWMDRLATRIIDRPSHPFSAVLNFLHGNFPCLWDGNRGSVAPLSIYLFLSPPYPSAYLSVSVSYRYVCVDAVYGVAFFLSG